MVIPMSRWRARQEEVEQVRTKCGAPEASCDFSTCWKSRIVEAITMDTETAEKLDVEEVVEEFTKEEENAESGAAEGSEEADGEEEASDEKDAETV